MLPSDGPVLLVIGGTSAVGLTLLLWGCFRLSASRARRREILMSRMAIAAERRRKAKLKHIPVSLNDLWDTRVEKSATNDVWGDIQPISVEEASSSTASKQSSSSPVIQVPGQCQVAVYIAFPESYLGQLPNLALGTSRVDYFDAGSANMPSESEAG